MVFPVFSKIIFHLYFTKRILFLHITQYNFVDTSYHLYKLAYITLPIESFIRYNIEQRKDNTKQRYEQNGIRFHPPIYEKTNFFLETHLNE